MILLTATTDKLQLVTDAAASVDVHVSYMDYTTVVVPGRQNTAITTATTTDILASPGASTQRNAKSVHIRNKHATVPCTVTVLFNQNATTFELHKVVLQAGDGLEYIEGVGFFLLAAALPMRFVLASDQSNSTVTPTKVTGISAPTAVGTYVFRYYVLYQSSSTTSGARLSVDHTGTVTAFTYHIEFPSAGTAASDALHDQDVTTAVAGIMNVLAARAKTQAGTGFETGVDTANADLLTVITGLAIVTVAGNLDLWHGSEQAAASTVKAGTTLILEKAA